MTELNSQDETCNPQPLATWIQGEEEADELCRPCILPVVVSWYGQELRERGEVELAEGLTQVSEGGDVVQLALHMDMLKDRVPPEVATALRSFDCLVQQEEIPEDVLAELLGGDGVSVESSPPPLRS